MIASIPSVHPYQLFLRRYRSGRNRRLQIRSRNRSYGSALAGVRAREHVLERTYLVSDEVVCEPE